MTELLSQHQFEIEEATAERIAEILIPGSNIQILESNYAASPEEINIATTQESNPSVLVATGASFCALVLGVAENGDASIIHEHLLIWGVEKLNHFNYDFHQTHGSLQNLFISGRWDLEEYEIQAQDEMIEKVFGDEPDICVIGELDWSSQNIFNGSSFQPEGVSTLIYIPKYLSQDQQNHILYLKNMSSEQRNLIFNI